MRTPASAGTGAGRPRPRHSRFYTWFAATVRWLHIYVSLIGFTALLFFAVTGITLNHPTWLGGDVQRVSDLEGKMALEWLRRPGATPPGDSAEAASSEAVDPEAGVDKLAVAEHLRSAHGLRGAVKEFRIDEAECMILFRGPAYAADAYVDRETGKYTVTQTAMGVVALFNDLHKGRDSGAAWSAVIDISALLMVLVSITGFVLIFYLKRRRRTGLILSVVGTVVFVGAYYLWVP